MGYPKITHVTFHFYKGDVIVMLTKPQTLISNAVRAAMDSTDFLDEYTAPGSALTAVRIHVGGLDPGRLIDRVYLDEAGIAV